MEHHRRLNGAAGRDERRTDACAEGGPRWRCSCRCWCPRFGGSRSAKTVVDPSECRSMSETQPARPRRRVNDVRKATFRALQVWGDAAKPPPRYVIARVGLRFAALVGVFGRRFVAPMVAISPSMRRGALPQPPTSGATAGTSTRMATSTPPSAPVTEPSSSYARLSRLSYTMGRIGSAADGTRRMPSYRHEVAKNDVPRGPPARRISRIHRCRTVLIGERLPAEIGRHVPSRR